MDTLDPATEHKLRLDALASRVCAVPPNEAAARAALHQAWTHDLTALAAPHVELHAAAMSALRREHRAENARFLHGVAVPALHAVAAEEADAFGVLAASAREVGLSGGGGGGGDGDDDTDAGTSSAASVSPATSAQPWTSQRQRSCDVCDGLWRCQRRELQALVRAEACEWGYVAAAHGGLLPKVQRRAVEAAETRVRCEVEEGCRSVFRAIGTRVMYHLS